VAIVRDEDASGQEFPDGCGRSGEGGRGDDVGGGEAVDAGGADVPPGVDQGTEFAGDLGVWVEVDHCDLNHAVG
jgi:hypothetical protein